MEWKITMNRKKFLNSTLIICSSIFIITAIILATILGKQLYLKYKMHDININSSVFSTDVIIDNPIDFKLYQQINPEIYAWIKVPNTNIDYPIAQSAANDEFYLHHDIYGKYVFSGTVYSEMRNSQDFTDPNTILYGHNMTSGYMFQNLFKYQNKDFFLKNNKFYIYTPGHILTYTIYTAYQYDDRHILNSFDFSNKQVFAQYIEDSKNPKYMIKNVNNEIKVTADDKIITLSTCLGDGKVYRYLVQGVLTDDQPTK